MVRLGTIGQAWVYGGVVTDYDEGVSQEMELTRPGSRVAGRREETVARQLTIGLLFLSPWLVGFLALTAYPMLASIWYSFSEFNIVTTPRWVGTANYVQALADPLVKQALGNTLYMVVIGTPIYQVSAFLFASLLDLRVRWQNTFRTIYFLPYLMPPVAAALMWTFILNPRFGLVKTPYCRWWALPGHHGCSVLCGPKPALILMGVWSLGSAV